MVDYHSSIFFPRPRAVRRFWAKVQRCEHGLRCKRCCWLWRACRSPKGYGHHSIRIDGKQHAIGAHRFAWLVCHGVIPDGLQVLHNCPDGDNPSCVNPSHLWLGTNLQNMQDSVRKGRRASGDRHPLRLHPEWRVYGERQGCALMTDERVADARYLSSCGMPHRLIAQIYEVTRSTITKCVSGPNWRHVEGRTT